MANTAVIAGVAAYFNIHPAATKWVELDNGFTYIYSTLPGQTDSTRHVLWMPAPLLTSIVRFKLAEKPSSIRRSGKIAAISSSIP
jgi:iron complex outermembrane receptor protein